jgi:hypothetical protein
MLGWNCMAAYLLVAVVLLYHNYSSLLFMLCNVDYLLTCILVVDYHACSSIIIIYCYYYILQIQYDNNMIL